MVFMNISYISCVLNYKHYSLFCYKPLHFLFFVEKCLFSLFYVDHTLLSYKFNHSLPLFYQRFPGSFVKPSMIFMFSSSWRYNSQSVVSWWKRVVWMKISLWFITTVMQQLPGAINFWFKALRFCVRAELLMFCFKDLYGADWKPLLLCWNEYVIFY